MEITFERKHMVGRVDSVISKSGMVDNDNVGVAVEIASPSVSV